MKKTLHVVVIFSLLILACTKGNAAVSNVLNEIIPEAELVGEARMTYMFWDVYDAKLYAKNGQFNVGQPFALSLHYLRKLKGKAIAERSIKEMRGQGVNEQAKLEQWEKRMVEIFPDVQDGSILIGVVDDSGKTLFYSGENKIGEVDDSEFGKHFFNIWLGENTSQPKLRKALLGK